MTAPPQPDHNDRHNAPVTMRWRGCSIAGYEVLCVMTPSGHLARVVCPVHEPATNVCRMRSLPGDQGVVDCELVFAKPA